MALRRRYVRVQDRYLLEYVNTRFPERVAYFRNFAIGPTPEELTKRHPELPEAYFRRWRRYADAIVILKDKMVCLEADVYHSRRGIADLIEYRRLVPQTPELRRWLELPLEIRLVVPIVDPTTVETAAEVGAIVDQFLPDWLKPILRKRGLLP